jgi:hypothetical protein
MTALAAAPAVAVRPVPWHRLAWVVWRRYRTTLVATVGVLAVFAVYLIVTGHQARTAYAAVQACTPAGASSCRFLAENFRNRYGSTGLLSAALILLPGLLGAFAGAPLLARELETGTFRYAWTQGVGRMRWAVALIGPAAIGIVAIMTAFGVVTDWHDKPLVSFGIIARLQPNAFSVTGLAIAGWTLVAFALGILAGLLWRRVLPALATAFAGWFGLAYLTVKVLRPRYQTPLTTTSLQLSDRNFFLGQWWTKGGVRVSNSHINSVLQAIGFQQVDGGGGKVTVAPGQGGGADPVQYLLQHGYTQVTQYQPDARFWTFQWIEFGWLALLSLVLIGTALWLLRRRPT